MSTASVLIGISGGLDSTFAALSLIEKGYSVEGAVLKFSESTDILSAKVAADELGIKLHIIDCQNKFKKHVKDYFVREYLCGRTPNPCVVCNKHVKIELLYQKSKELGFDCFATGHYCGVSQENGRYFITRAEDEKKDQSYMLWGLSQEQLASFLTPLNGTKKADIRAYMAKKGFTSASSKESQDICFIPDGDYAKYICENHGKSSAGNFIDANGKILGSHKGIIYYTVGQKKGLGIALGEKMAVVDINSDRNEVTLIKAADYRPAEKIFFSGLNFQYLTSINEAVSRDDLTVKVRYSSSPRQTRVQCKENICSATFEPSFPDAAPGQSAVFYIGDKLAFGGFIDSRV